jgi:ABC-type transport system involved in multi-copper enzyme maturation permease subunit
VVGAVYDRGYRGYEGTRGGRSQARSALFRASVRRALGIRRPWQQKLAPFTLLAIATVPAIVFVGAGYLTRDTVASEFEFITYREYVGVSSSLLMFVALTAPDIMCPDRRQRVLPVLFARPLTGVDYVLAKVAAMFAIVFAFAALPQVVLFLGQMLVSDDGALRYARDNAEVLWQVPIAVSVLALYYAVIGTAISSLTSRRIIAGATIIGVLLISSIVSQALIEGSGTREEQPAPTFEPGPPVTDPDTGEVIFTPAGPGGFDDFQQLDRKGAAAELVNLYTIPLVVRDLVFLGEVSDDPNLTGVANGGLYALLIYAGVVFIGVVVLLRRYQEVER